jgi:metal-responsive CopG/Arc/MetJ family transcriptional regulator
MKTALTAETTKDDFIYARIEKELVNKIDILQEEKVFKNRSQAIRCLISWSFENGLEKLEKPEKKKREKRFSGDNLDEVIYTRIEKNLLAKIDEIRHQCKLDNRSQTIREIILWAFCNGAGL